MIAHFSNDDKEICFREHVILYVSNAYGKGTRFVTIPFSRAVLTCNHSLLMKGFGRTGYTP